MNNAVKFLYFVNYVNVHNYFDNLIKLFHMSNLIFRYFDKPFFP